MNCDDCGGQLEPVSVIGGDACSNCDIFYSPYGFRKNWEVR